MKRPFAALMVAASLACGLARAQPGEPGIAPRVAPSAEVLEAAKALFRQGNELRRAGDCARAAELFLRSRRLVPSVPNTLNAAFCLQSIGRQDEALELYEELLTVFRAELTDDQRAAIAPALAPLRAAVGGLSISANVDGMVVIDGVPRGRLPLAWPLRVAPGKHLVRVLREGFETWESTVEITAGQTAARDARLTPLAKRGRLRVEAPAGAVLLVDGAQVGTLPWEGSLSPGAHTVATRLGDGGSAPILVEVVDGQTVTAAVSVAESGAEVELIIQPAEAALRVDGVPVGNGRWLGWLPAGRHAFEAALPGYVTRTDALDVVSGARLATRVTLSIDEKHPSWDARRAEAAARNVDQRTTDELGVLYFSSVLYGVEAGLAFDAATGVPGTRAQALSLVLFSGGAVSAVALGDRTPFRYGVPQSIVSGGYIGLEHGLAWVGSRLSSDAGMSTATALGLVWGATTVGAVGGGVLGASLGTTPGRASYVGSSTLWFGVTTGLFAGAVSQDVTTSFTASAIGLSVGTVAGLATAGAVAPSTARVRYLDVGGVSGALVGLGTYAVIADRAVTGPGALASMGAGSLVGLGVTAYVTRRLPRDERPGDLSWQPMFTPSRGGLHVAVGGRF